MGEKQTKDRYKDPRRKRERTTPKAESRLIQSKYADH